uniref:GG23295 n=2 Tax=Drosophila erecta TaxID=7220 RepID=B3P0B5_DROER
MELAYIRDELKRKLSDSRNFLIESDRAVVIKADFPKSQYHFRVVAKDELRDITQLTEEQLPLLDHMMDLANQVIEKQDHLESRNFRIGFKVHTFWNRLNLHVISDDFYSMAMKRPQHWNSFNTELFLPLQMAHMLLSVQGSIEPIPEERLKELEHQMPLRCNQCDFSTDLLLDLKAHLYHHWLHKEGEREQKKKMDKIIQMLNEPMLDEAAKPKQLSEEPAQTQPVADIAPKRNPTQRKPLTPHQQQGKQQAQHGYDNLVYGPPVNIMNQNNPNNPFRNTPPFNIKAQALNPPRPMQPGFRSRGPRPFQRPMAPHSGPRFPPSHHQNRFRLPGYNAPHQPNPMVGGQAEPPGQQQGARPKTNRRYGSGSQHPNQKHKSQDKQLPK